MIASDPIRTPLHLLRAGGRPHMGPGSPRAARTRATCAVRDDKREIPIARDGSMFAVIFEVQPRQERWGDYLDLAKQLKPKLEAIDGFIDIDRLESKRTSGRLLSFSTWRNEKAVIRWRTQAEHHAA